MPRQEPFTTPRTGWLTTWAGLLACATVAITAILLFACVGISSAPRGQDRRQETGTPLILVSLDGFRWDFMDLTETPALDKLAASGVRAQRLIPVFPTKTFPNHYTIVTGLYPEHHGIVANNFYDPTFDSSFILTDAETLFREAWWEGEPIWVTAERQGLTAATYFWPGSEAAFDGIRPTYWKSYDHSVPYGDRIDQILAWLDPEAGPPPDFIALYLDLVDTVAHSYDPDSPESSPQVAEAIRTVDAAVGRLLAGLTRSGQFHRVNLLVVSDHGMASTSRERVIFLDDSLDTQRQRISDWNPIVSIWPEASQVDQVYEALAGAHPHLRVFRKEDIPPEWHYRGHRRIPPILGVADEGWSITTHAAFGDNPAFYEGATHGYDPALDSMGALLVASGPAFEPGLLAPPVRAIDLYELMCRILDLTPAPNDGDAEGAAHILRR